MSGSVLQRRIPTLFGVALVGVGIFLSSWFLQTGALFPTQAASGSTPLDVRISNVRDDSFTLSFRTTEKVIGYVVFGKSKDETLRAVDVRDKDLTAPSKQLIHSITLDNLTPGTKYYYRIFSGGKEYLKSGEPFEFLTPAALTSASEIPVNLSGKVFQDSEMQSLVYVSVGESQVLSVLTNMDGSFALGSSDLRSKDFGALASYNDASIVTILISNGNLSSKISASLASSDILPPITLSQNYDFTLGVTPVGNFDASDSASLAGFPSIVVDEDEKKDTVEILTPEKDEGFSDQQPKFDGSALPNAEVEIIIHSGEQIKASVKTNSRGAWNFRPTKPLSPGEHTITVRSRDSFGILKEIKQSFVVYAEGSQFTDPSVSPARTLTVTKAPTPTVIVSPSITPKATPTVTLAPTEILLPTITLTPTLVALAPTNTPPQVVPEAGSPMIILSGLFGAITISVGLFVLFMSRGGAL